MCPGGRSWDVAAAVLNGGIGSWPARRARMTPHRTALVHDASTLTYADLSRRVNQAAQVLLQHGVQPGDRVAYLGPNHPAFLETFFATAAVGAIFVPLNTRLAPAELGYMLRDSGSSLLIWDVACTDSLDGVGSVAGLDHRIVVNSAVTDRVGADERYEALVTAAPTGPIADQAVSLDDVCMIMYTSGTTGKPKGAMLSHGNLTWNCYNLLLDLDLTGAEVALVSAPLFHTAALNHTVLPVFLKGGTSVLVSKFHPEASYDLIRDHGITLMFGVPAMFQQISASPHWETADLSSLRILHCGGAPVPESLIRRYQQRGLTFVQGYGMTEASPGTMVLRPEDSVRKIGSAGKPHFFTDVRVLRPDLSEASIGESGEIVVQGPNVMQGYWQRPEDTAVTLSDGWLHTGDAAVIDDEGFVFVVDRIKDMIISGGENVYPAEVESALYEHPAVLECVVVGIPDEKWGEAGRAVIVVRQGETIGPDDIIAFLGGRLARYKIPRSIVIVDELPHNASGKVRRIDVRHAFGADR